VRDAIPVIYIGTNRSLKEQLPSARYSLLRQMFEDIDRRLHETSDTVTVKRTDGTENQVTRVERFRTLMQAALQLLRTQALIQVETAIKRNVLLQLGFDPPANFLAVPDYEQVLLVRRTAGATRVFAFTLQADARGEKSS
jgi:putative ATP-dependent endonuclease of the OLD family